MGDFVYDAGGDPRDQIVGEAGPVGRHEIVGGYGPKGHGVIVGAFVAHDADASEICEDGKILVHMAVEAGGADFLPENGVAFPDDFRLLRSHLADDPNGQARPREGLAPDQLPRKPQGFAQHPDLVLEKHAQGLDQLGEAELLRQPTHVVVALDNGGVCSLAALNDVRIDGALGKIVHFPQPGGFFPEDLDEIPADDVPLFLRFRYAPQIREEAGGGVGPDKADREKMAEYMADLFAFPFAKQAVIHENAGEPVPDGPVNQRGGYGGIHAAGQGQQDGARFAHRLPDLPDGGFSEGAHGPVPGAAAALEQEIPDQHAPVLGMGDFGMKLDAADLLFILHHGGHRTVIRFRDDPEARGACADLPGVAHPAGGGAFQSSQQPLPFLHPDGDPAVFPLRGLFHPAAKEQGGQLHAIADAQDGDARLIDGGIDPGRAFVMDAGGTAGEDDALRPAGKDFG